MRGAEEVYLSKFVAAQVCGAVLSLTAQVITENQETEQRTFHAAWPDAGVALARAINVAPTRLIRPDLSVNVELLARIEQIRIEVLPGAHLAGRFYNGRIIVSIG